MVPSIAAFNSNLASEEERETTGMTIDSKHCNQVMTLIAAAPDVYPCLSRLTHLLVYGVQVLI